MSRKFSLDVEVLEVESFALLGEESGPTAETYSVVRACMTSGPCLNSEQTCDTACWA